MGIPIEKWLPLWVEAVSGVESSIMAAGDMFPRWFMVTFGVQPPL